MGFKTVVARGVTGCVRLTEDVLQAMEDYNGLAPAHNPPYITGIRLFARRMPETPLVGLFETAFYQFAPEPMMRYAVPDAWRDIGIRRWGFHGASHKFIAERSAELLGRADVAERARKLYVDGAKTPVNEPALRVISCHLGGSSSITGILNGAAIGNSLGIVIEKPILELERQIEEMRRSSTEQSINITAELAPLEELHSDRPLPARRGGDPEPVRIGPGLLVNRRQ